jgi:glycosyltransferase involved in cell wall biosynthesis
MTPPIEQVHLQAISGASYFTGNRLSLFAKRGGWDIGFEFNGRTTLNRALTLPNAPLRVCLLSYRCNPHSGGQGVYVKNLSRALREMGHTVDVLAGPPEIILNEGVHRIALQGLDLYNPADPFRMPTLSELADPVNLIEWVGVASMGFPEPFTFGLRAWRFLKPRLADYDILHDNQSLSYAVWAFSRRIPTVATIHHPVTVDRRFAVRAERTPLRKIQRWRWYSFIGMQKRVARALAPIITVSECARRDLSREFRIPTERFRVVPNGIDTDLFRPLPGVEREPDRIIVTNSADMPLKGLTHLLTAVAEVRAVRPRLRLVVIGAPKKNGAVERRLAELGLEPRVCFTGRIGDADLVRHYARARLAVVPSVYEGFGLPAGEAMACAVPVVSTTGGALPEVVGDAGILVPPADPAALGQAILRLLDRPQLARELGQRGFERVRRHFTWRRAALQTLDAYREAIDGHRRFRPA